MGCLRCLSRVKSFHVKILLLDKQELIQEIQDKTTGQDLLDIIFKYLNLIETAYFGLRYQDNDNQTHWLDPGKRVCQQIHGVAPITLYLGVKFYAADPCRLVEEITRYQFFLQVKQDVLQGRLPVTQDLAVELAALSLQSELGDYDPKQHSSGYVSEFRFISAQTEEFEADVEAAHSSMTGMGIMPATAEMTYLEKVKWLDMYGVDLHPVIGEDNIEYFLGLTPSGIIVLRNRSKVGNYFWPRITKIYFKGKYFMLRVRDKNNDDSTYGFETPSRQACKHLWKCCVEHHAFFRLVQVSPSFGGTGVFSLGSRFRYSGHTEKQVMQEQLQSVRRQPPQFTRRPSKRHSRRFDGDQRDGNGNEENSQNKSNHQILSPVVLSSLANGSLKRHTGHKSPNPTRNQRHTTNSLPRHVSLMASRSSRLEATTATAGGLGEESLQDLSLQSLQWLESRGLYGNSQQPQQPQQQQQDRTTSLRRGSLPEQIQANGFYNRKKQSGQSDNESDASGVSWTSGLHSRRRNESGSESERSVRRTHRSRRKRQGSYKLVESDEQWQAMQQQRQQHRSNSRNNNNYGDVSTSSAAMARKSGYMNSGAETEAEMTSHASMKRNKRRQRSRSRSPGESRARLPAEILQHLEFGLVEPNDETLRGEIPFTNVETTSRHYQQSRSRQLKTATTRSVVSAVEATLSSPAERFNRAETSSMASGHNTSRVRQGQNDNRRHSPSSASPAAFIWPSNASMTNASSSASKYVTTSTPVTRTPTPVTRTPTTTYFSPTYNKAAKSFNSVGLPVGAIPLNTQYQSPYALPQSSSGSSVSRGELPPPPLPPISKPSYHLAMNGQQQQPMTMRINGGSSHYPLPPTVLMPPQRSPHNENMRSSPQNGYGRQQQPQQQQQIQQQQQQQIQQQQQQQIQQQQQQQQQQMYPQKYLHHQSRIVRSNGFTTAPSGDEMSTEL